MNLRRSALRFVLGHRDPVTKGTLRLEGPDARIVIRRDENGIPHITAQTDDDAWFALGFCQGQDRAFQLDLRLRTARGTLSALVGPRTLDIDRLSRRIGFRDASLRQLGVLAPDVLAQIESFARGMNAGIAHGLQARPHEFVLLRGRPTTWEAADVLAMGKLISFLLAGNWDVELARLKILQLDGPEALRALDPTYPEQHDVSIGGLAAPALDRLTDDIERFQALAGRSGGSNNWALAGSKTRSRRPLLANDPHLDPTLPPHWYLAHITTPRWGVAGASLIGGPAIGSGHNGFAAWGITAGLVDTADLYLEDVGGDGRSVRRGDALVPCEVRREVIEVKGGPDVVEEVLVTDRGPIIGPALSGEVGAIGMQAVWLQARPARGFLRVHEARSFESFRREFEQWPLLNQNVAYADESGTIGWQLVGEAPVRRTGWGTLPSRGSDPDAGWEKEHIPFDSMPHVENPASGFVATANNKPARDGDTPYLGVDWLDGYRVGRINEALAARDDWDVADTLALHMDRTSRAWQEVRGALQALKPAHPDARWAIETLSRWDGVLANDSVAASVYEHFIAEIWGRIARAKAPRSSQWALGQGFATLLPLTTFALGRTSHVIDLVNRRPEGWFAQGWEREMEASLVDAVEKLTTAHGSDRARWGWGQIRRLTLKHPVGAIPALAPVFNRGPFDYGGDGSTIAQAGLTPLRPTGNPLAIASLRVAIEVGDWDNARFSLPGGQSGNPISPHYDDLLPLWLQGEGIPIPWSNTAVAAATRQTLLLEPLHPNPDTTVRRTVAG